jgi:hypothetical protein
MMIGLEVEESIPAFEDAVFQAFFATGFDLACVIGS